MLKIVSAPNNVLSEKVKEVSKIDKSILHLIEEMKVTLNNTHDPEGIGLAAPQVGKNLQIFIVKPTKKSKTQVFINPKIHQPSLALETNETFDVTPNISDLSASSETESKSTKLEGCLSLPNIWGEVKREPQIIISYLDEYGKHHKKIFKGFIATIIQHEYDHLQGTLFPKRVLEQKGKLYKSSKNKKGEDEFEEIEI